MYSFQLFGVMDQDMDTLPSSKSIRTLDEEARPETDAVVLPAPMQLEAEAVAFDRLRLGWMAPAQVRKKERKKERKNSSAPTRFRQMNCESAD